MNQSITIVRQYKGVGIDSKLNGFDMETQKSIKRSVYHGRIVYILNGKQIGVSSIKKESNRCNIIFDNTMPF